MLYFFSFYAVTWLIANVSGRATRDGPCSQFQTFNVVPFYRKPFMGLWYLYASHDYPEIAGKDCITFNYHLTLDGAVQGTERGKNLATNERSLLNSRLVFDRPGEGHYQYQIPGEPSEPIQIIATDYIKYYIEFECDETDGKSKHYVGIYTRHAMPDPRTLRRINLFLEIHHLDRAEIRYITHDASSCIF